MMKHEWSKPAFTVVPMDLSGLGDVNQLSDAELKIELEKRGYQFKKKYQASRDFMHKVIADSDVLISIGSNIADFNGYIEINESAAALWDAMQEPCELGQLEKVLEEKYGLPHETAVEDVLDFVNVLMETEMVQVS